MRLSSALDQRLKELQVWRQEVVLAIRKAFTFDDTVIQGEVSSIPFKHRLVFIRSREGYGLEGNCHVIVVRPDAFARKIVVTKTIRQVHGDAGTLVYIEGEESSVTCIDAPLTPEGTLADDLVSKLQVEIVDFLASAELELSPIDW